MCEEKEGKQVDKKGMHSMFLVALSCFLHISMLFITSQNQLVHRNGIKWELLIT